MAHFGDLNPRDIDTRTREITNDTRGIDYIRDSLILANANKANSLKSTGPYLAEVLKVFTSAEDKQAFKSASGFNLWGSVDSKPTGEIVTIIARIPEIHHYDLPSKLPLNPDNPNYRKDVKIVDMYPRFVAQKAGLPMPKVGQVVWVDFEDKVSYSGGIYLGTLDSTEVVSNAISEGTTMDAWKKGSTALPTAVLDSLQLGTYMIFGDSQARGHLGKAVERKLKEYGLTPVAGFNRKLTTRSGAQIREFVPIDSNLLRKGLGNLKTTGIYSKNGQSGPKTIEPFLLKSTKNVIWIGGGNSAGNSKTVYKPAMKEIIDNIIKSSGTDTKITLIGPPAHFTKYKDQAKNKKYNEKRLQVNIAFEELASEYSNVVAFNGYRYFPDQEKTDTTDGVHLNASGANKLINRIFPRHLAPTLVAARNAVKNSTSR